MTAVRILRLTARCPSCGAPPRLRATEDVKNVMTIADPEKVLMQYQCHRELPDETVCNTVYEIKAKHFQSAA